MSFWLQELLRESAQAWNKGGQRATQLDKRWRDTGSPRHWALGGSVG